MTIKTMLLIWLVIAAACAIVGYVIVNRQYARTAASIEQSLASPTPIATPAPVAPQPTPTVQVTAPVETTPQTRPAPAAPPVRRPATVAPTPQPAPIIITISEPVAREALALVGTDPAAEEVYVRAINDPSLPADSRRELIEDLNQDGFADPRNPTSAELPLIVNRIQLLEQLAPSPMDDTNAAAFDEAYKDLVDMYNRLTGR